MLTAIQRERASSRTASPERDVWTHFRRRFRRTYGSEYPWDGEGTSWPAAVEGRDELGWMPLATANGDALKALADLANGEAVEACIRIDRMFAHPAHVAGGISLRRIANWWDDLASATALEAKTLDVLGADALPRARRAS